jgi:hypothetical protein
MDENRRTEMPRPNEHPNEDTFYLAVAGIDMNAKMNASLRFLQLVSCQSH